MPHAYCLIFAIIIMATLLTYIVPAGQYDMIESNGAKVIDPNSFHYVENKPITLFEMIKAIPQGLNQRSNLIFMVIVISGATEIINKTLAVEAVIGRAAHVLKNKIAVVLPFFMLFFGLLGASNVNNSIVAFMPLGMMIASNLGADAIVAVALVSLGMNLGFTAGFFSAGSVGIAQTICGLPMFSGYIFRIIILLVFVAICSVFTVRYAKRVQLDPANSLLYNVDTAVSVSVNPQDIELTTRRKVVFSIFSLGVVLIVYGSMNSWNATDVIPAIFLCIGIICGLAYGFTPNEIAAYFVEGAKKMTFGSIIIGFSAAIGIVLSNGQIIHTIVHALASLMHDYPKIFAAELMFVINILMNIILISGSGQASAIMPIMSPLATALGLTQQTAVLAFQLGDGISNQMLPTSAVLMACLAFGGIPFGKWLQFIWKQILVLHLVGGVFILIAVLINYGPF